jgi:hypothetical protein
VATTPGGGGGGEDREQAHSDMSLQCRMISAWEEINTALASKSEVLSSTKL